MRQEGDAPLPCPLKPVLSEARQPTGWPGVPVSCLLTSDPSPGWSSLAAFVSTPRSKQGARFGRRRVLQCVCVCVCICSLLGPSRCLQPWTGGREDTDRSCSSRYGVPRGEERDQAGPGASQHRRSTVLLRRRAVGLQLARQSQGSPRAHLAGWTCSRRVGTQHWAPRHSPAVVSPLPDACASPLTQTLRSRCPPLCSGPATLSEGLAPPAPQTLRLLSSRAPSFLHTHVCSICALNLKPAFLRDESNKLIAVETKSKKPLQRTSRS